MLVQPLHLNSLKRPMRRPGKLHERLIRLRRPVGKTNKTFGLVSPTEAAPDPGPPESGYRIPFLKA